MTPPATAGPALACLAQMPAWLRAPSEPNRVAEALRTVVPELAAGSLSVLVCGSKLRIKTDRPGWTASYDLVIAERGTQRQVRVSGTFVPPGPALAGIAISEGAFGSQAWRACLPNLGLELGTRPDDDGELPALSALTEPEEARRLLEEAIGADAHPAIRIRSVIPDVRRYKPGSRCTIYYGVALAEGSPGPSAVVAKTYRGDKGENAFVGMRALWSAGLGAGTTLALAEPLAYLSDLRVLVQAAVPEEMTLKELVRTAVTDGPPATMERLRRSLSQIATGLARMHASGVDHGVTVNWHDESAEIHELLDRLEPWLPEATTAARSLLGEAARLEAEVPAETAVPTHRSFRPAQVLLHNAGIAFIDFDGLCMAEPALDIAMFRASLRDAGTRALPSGATPAKQAETAEILDGLCDDFLDHYASRAAVSSQRVAVWETLHLLTSVLHCWSKVKPERLSTRIALLARHLDRQG